MCSPWLHCVFPKKTENKKVLKWRWVRKFVLYLVCISVQEKIITVLIPLCFVLSLQDYRYKVQLGIMSHKLWEKVEVAYLHNVNYISHVGMTWHWLNGFTRRVISANALIRSLVELQVYYRISGCLQY